MKAAVNTHHVSAFDLDHTLLKENCSFQFGAFLYQHQLFNFTTMLYMVSCYALHKMGLMSIASIQHKIFKKFFRGLSAPLTNDLVQKFLDLKLESLLYDPAMDHLKTALEQGHYSVILSSSPSFLVGPIAERLGVHSWVATHYSLDHKQHFCAIDRLIQGKDKASYLDKLARGMRIDRSCITAYSDSILDLPFLEAAGKVVGVNPDRLLKNLCKENNWLII